MVSCGEDLGFGKLDRGGYEERWGAPLPGVGMVRLLDFPMTRV